MKQIMITNVNTKTKLKALNFLKDHEIHDNGLNACGRMILEIVQKVDVLNQYVWGELW